MEDMSTVKVMELNKAILTVPPTQIYQIRNV